VRQCPAPSSTTMSFSVDVETEPIDAGEIFSVNNIMTAANDARKLEGKMSKHHREAKSRSEARPARALPKAVQAERFYTADKPRATALTIDRLGHMRGH
jgi:hypothetical protein